ncbi:MAG TPA: hypothetical protein VFX98_11800, partial [Longimicrobiaceae bacterium]|nr:hypothetical protein [Longimicrobiaceae bacterium]
GADLRPLAERLEVEREWKRSGFSIKAWPVAIPAEGVVRVNFSSNVSHVKPPVGEAVRLLAARSRGEPKDYLMVDLTAVYAIPAHDRERSLRALLHSGHYLLALQLARDLYGIKDEKAKEILARLEAPVPAAVTQPS